MNAIAYSRFSRSRSPQSAVLRVCCSTFCGSEAIRGTMSDIAPYRGEKLNQCNSRMDRQCLSGRNSRLFPSGWGRFSLPVSNMRGFVRPPWSYSAGTYTEVTFPHWFPALVSGTLAAAPWATHIKWRFSLRIAANRHDASRGGTRPHHLRHARLTNEIPQAANRVVGVVGHRVCAADRVMGAELLVIRLHQPGR